MSRGQMIAAAGGVGLIVSLFISWAAGQDAFQAFSAVDILMLIIAVIALVYGLAPALSAQGRLPGHTPWILAALGFAAFGWAIGFEFEASGDFGVWLGVFSSLAIAYGAAEAAGWPLLVGAGPSGSRLGGAPPPAAAAPPPPAAAPPPPPPPPPATPPAGP